MRLQEIIHKHRQEDGGLVRGSLRGPAVLRAAGLGAFSHAGRERQPARMARETESQFALRAKRLAGGEGSHQAERPGAAKEDTEEREAGAVPSATRRMARYFVARKTWAQAERRQRARGVLCGFLLACVAKLRRARLVRCVIQMQRVVRGFAVRSNAAALVEALRERKIERLLARIRIRRWVRHIPDAIHDARQNKMLLRKRRKSPAPKLLAERKTASAASKASKKTSSPPSSGRVEKEKDKEKDTAGAGVQAVRGAQPHGASWAEPAQPKRVASAPVTATTTTISSSAAATITATAATAATASAPAPAPASGPAPRSSLDGPPPSQVSIRTKAPHTDSTGDAAKPPAIAAPRQGSSSQIVPKLPVLLIAELQSMQESPGRVAQWHSSHGNQNSSSSSASTSTSGSIVSISGSASGSAGASITSDPHHLHAHHSPRRAINDTDSGNATPLHSASNDDELSMTPSPSRNDLGGYRLAASPRRARALSSDSAVSGGSEKASEKTDALFLTGSLSGLGIEHRDRFTPQQREILLGMWAVLREGVEVLKHGRTGRPKQRFLYCDEHLTAMFWRASVRTRDP